jgi:hypothetical protein
MQVRQGKLGGEAMIEDDIGNVWYLAMSGDCDHRNRKTMFQRRIDGDERVSATAKQHPAVFFDQIFAVPVVRGEVEVSRLHQMIANTTHHLRVVAITEFGNENSDG